MTRHPKQYIVRRHRAPRTLPEFSAIKTMWLPTDDPWQWQTLPIPPELLSIRTKEDVIAAIFNYPACEVLPETDEQQDALVNAQAHFKLVAAWLDYRLLEKSYYRDSLFSRPDSLIVKPYADLSAATLEFC